MARVGKYVEITFYERAAAESGGGESLDHKPGLPY